MQPAVSIDALTVVRSGHTVLDAVTTTVPAGSITGLLGPSGCGKTTLMRATVGAQKISAGTVTVLGRPAGNPALRSEIGYVTQSPSVYSDLTVEANVRYFAALYPARRGTAAADVEDALAAVGLADHRDRRADALSGGQKTRVSVACALVAHPSLLVLDEPTVGLDPVLRADLWDRFTALAAAGTTLLISSHVMDEAAHCHRLILLRDGRLVADLTSDELRERTGEQGLDDAFLALIRRQEARP